MRKDVKLGFTIGGILLAVLIAYVLVVPEREPSDVQLVDANGQPIAAQPALPETSGAAESAPAITSDSTRDTPAVVPSNDTNETEETARGGVASATPETPTDPAPSANASDVDWDALLGGGEVLMTRTPAVPGPRSEVAVASANDATASAPQNVPVIDSSALVVADAAPTVPTTQPMTAGTSRTHIVRGGETLSSISKAAYGSANFYPHILRANPGLDANRLKVGATITLPPVEQVAPAGLAEPSKPIDAGSEYRVASGDSLYSISMRLYGSAERMSEIYELNKSTIGADPSKLKLNMVLKLPTAPTKTASR